MKTFKSTFLSAAVVSSLCATKANAQLTATANNVALDLITELTGLNVTVTNATLTCPTGESGMFTYGGSVLPISDGIILSTCDVTAIAGSAVVFLSAGASGPGDPTLSTVVGAPTYNACALECDVVADYDTLYLNYSFASEEYPEYNCSVFNDVFGFFITGPGFPTDTNFAIVPNTTIPTAINSVNDGTTTNNLANCTNMGPGSPFTQYYIDNLAGTEIAFDGMTTKIEAFIEVTTGVPYHLKFVVANTSDNGWQSGVFMEGGSLASKNAAVTKVANVNKEGKTLIYPNPFKDDMSVTLPENMMNKTVDVLVVNSVGQNVYHYNGVGGGLNESIRNKAKVLNAGIYTMTIQSEGYEQVVKFQKQ